MTIVDGKIAGLSSSPEEAVRRLEIKLRHEKEPSHRWFLHEYLKFARRVSREGH